MKFKVPENVLANNGFKSQRDFRKQKRAQVRAVKKAMQELRAACIYMADGCRADIVEIDRRVESLLRKTSVKEWGA